MIGLIDLHVHVQAFDLHGQEPQAGNGRRMPGEGASVGRPGLPAAEQPVTRFQLTGSLLRDDGLLRSTSRRLSVEHERLRPHGRSLIKVHGLEHGEDSSMLETVCYSVVLRSLIKLRG